ncbi:MAG TPA: GDP-mannose 4,6-dehydratase [Candidatus Saccharimonadales bacterium]|nr:GDP-mannose 4,6-dehydratase [Candidatus Saccharimonadales bacterium]
MIVITGANGFVGHHLSEACAQNGKDILGIGYGELAEDSKLKGWLKEYKAINLVDKDDVETQLDLSSAETVFHLAGLAAVGLSFEQPARYIADNTAMLINLAEKALKDGSKARFIVVSSGAVYDPNQKLPISEKGKTISNSPYAISKITTEMFCEYYRSRGLDMIIVRPFNHIGPGQGPGFLLPDLVAQAQKYDETGKFMVGNLDTRRDYTDVRDVVQAYMAIAQSKDLGAGLYNVCSGKSHAGKEILDEIIKNMALGSPKIEIDQSKIRPNDVMDIYGDNSQIKADTGWEPKIPLEKSVTDFIKSV